MPVRHAFVSGVSDDPAAAAAGKVLPSQWDDDHTIVGGMGDGIREQLLSDTTYYVDPSGDDTTGDGSVGNPWATIQHAANYVMYDVTGQGVKVKIKVADGTYPENLLLGPHQVFSPTGNMGAVAIEFSAKATPANVVIAPTSAAPADLLGIINLENSLWELTGGFTLTQGTSGNNAGFVYYLGAQLRIFDAAVVFSDDPGIAFDGEFSSELSVGQDVATTVTFNSTVGSLILVDHDIAVDFYPDCDVHFDVDPGFVGAFGGMYAMSFGGGCRVTMRNTFSGATPAAPSASVIGSGNVLNVANDIQTFADYTIQEGARYNDSYNAIGINVIPSTPLHIAANASGGPPFAQVTIEETSGIGPNVDYFDRFNSSDWENGLIAKNFYFFDNTNNIQPFVVSDDGTNTLLCAPALGVWGWSNSNNAAAGNPGTGVGTQAVDTGFSKVSPAVVGIGNGTQGDFSGALKLTNLHVDPVAIASLPGSPVAGDIAAINDGDASLTNGQTPVNSGGGATEYLVAYLNGGWVIVV